MLQPRGSLAAGDPAMNERAARAARIIAGSAALQTREQQIVDRTTRSLAEIVAAERRAGASDMRPWVVANALMGVNRAIARGLHGTRPTGRRRRSRRAPLRSHVAC